MNRRWNIQDDTGKIVDQVAGPGELNSKLNWQYIRKAASPPICNDPSLQCMLLPLNQLSGSLQFATIELYLGVAGCVCSMAMALIAGVVGNTPILKPYDCFQYYSSAALESSQGAMYGTFEMLSHQNHELFSAQIPPFKLIAPK